MIIDSGNCVCEKCGKEIRWVLADTSFESCNIKGYVDNGRKLVASVRCPCGYVQSKGLVYESRKCSI